MVTYPFQLAVKVEMRIYTIKKHLLIVIELPL
jgi:hypothetical protein